MLQMIECPRIAWGLRRNHLMKGVIMNIGSSRNCLLVFVLFQMCFHTFGICLEVELIAFIHDHFYKT